MVSKLYTVHMFRPFNILSVVILAAASLASQGCRTHTIYRDVYAPKRSYFVPPEEKKEVIPPPAPTPTTTAPVTPQVTPPGAATVPGGAAAPAPAPMASPSGIPGL